MSDERDGEDEGAKATPAVPGITRNEDRAIAGDTPDEPAPDEDDDDPAAPFDAENGPLGVADDDTLGVSDEDDRERDQGATEA
jgi:hypothetical protein